nr:M14 family metallopeptidase [Solirubrobacter pauli]
MAAATLSGLAVSLTATGSAGAASAPLDVYVGDLSRAQIAQVVKLGVDRHELKFSKAREGGKDSARVEVILSGAQADKLRAEGVELEAKEIDGKTVAERATLQAADGMEVFKSYDEIKADFEKAAKKYWPIAKLVNLGKSGRGKDIVGIKISLGAPLTRDGSKPAVLYIGAQHAREWITPEMNRRLMHYLLENYTRDRKVRELINTRELWIVPVANPDGYDYTFQPGQRLWRKNLRDNNGNGTTEPGDGVDLNRNFAYKWGYDNEGSSPDPTSETFRGPAPTSEPENKALEGLVRRITPEFFVNYHSAAQLLLYGTGWQVATPSPDDIIGETLAGDDAHPAVPGYDPDLSAELYTTNGDTDTHMQENYGAFGFTPEMGTCASAANENPDDEWVAEDCGSDFEFPDDEALVEAEFRRNIPFALSVAESADDPADPESVVGREAPDFVPDTFDVSYGDPQTVAVVAKRELKKLRLNYRINNGKTKTVNVSEWRGGERYGDEMKRYYAEFRGEVKGARAGDRVKVWFSGEKKSKRWYKDDEVESTPFTYTVKSDTGAKVLVLANEDYTGYNPEEAPYNGQPRYLAAHVNAARAAGYSVDVWDVDKQGVPHDLAVLSHYKGVLWYVGDNQYTQDEEDFLIDTGPVWYGELPYIGVAERQQYLTLAVRDYLNAGGKLLHAGEWAQDYGIFEGIAEGLYYGLNGAPDEECVITTGLYGVFDDCLILANDFRQYWLGAYSRISLPGPNLFRGIASPIAGFEAPLSGTPTNPIDSAGVFQPTSDVLPVSQFPQFASQGAAEYDFTGDPTTPPEGSNYAAAVHQDNSYMRLTKTFDLRTVTAADAPKLTAQLSYLTEDGFDHVIVEARTAGGDDWTTLPDLNGGTTNDPSQQCEQGYLLDLHPFLEHYLTLGATACTNTGTTGQWNAFTGSSGGWQDVAFDLAAYAGKQVEITFSYVGDPSTGLVGAFLDDTALVVGAQRTQLDGFEGATSTWTVQPQPEGSPENPGNWEIGPQTVQFYAGTSTQDTLLLGFGLEQMTNAADRAALIRRAFSGLGVR